MMHRDPPPLEARHVILHGLRILARLDPDHADHRNDVGFSASDSRRGHELAALPSLSNEEATQGLDLVTRYWRQLPPDVVAAARRRAPRPVLTLSDALDGLVAMRAA